MPSNAEEAEIERFCEDLQDLLELTSKIRRCPSHHRGLESKSRKSRNTWINRQVWPWSTEWSREKFCIEFCQKNTLIKANTLFQQHRRWLYTLTSPNGQYQNEIDYIFCSEDGEALYSQQKHNLELTVAQIISSLSQNSDLNWRE